ncbi:hypothetical protein IWW48_002870 [Coemansia sp. RSA 1200]|nr:hypothetical protein IWW48_002870 [Coemansia sp. RSA 1200]
MPTKRGYPEGEGTAGVGPSGKTADQENAHSAAAGESSTRRTRLNEAYTTYEQVHLAMVGLKRGRATAATVHESASRALATVRTGSAASSSAVRQAAVLLARQVCAYPEADTGGVVGELVQTLGTAAPSTRSEIYRALERIHEFKGVFSASGSTAVPEPTMRQLDAAVRRDLNHAQHHLRCAALAVLALAWMRSAAAAAADGRGLFDVVCRYAADSHPKVRQTALATMARQHTLGVRLPVDTYDDCVVATKDDYEQVRLAAAELVWIVGSAYPDHPVVIHKYRTSETIRLLDDAFVKICDMVNDSSVVVRQRASAILGRFTNVDGKFLSQTFSKQVMSNLRRFAARGPRGYAGRNRGVRVGGGNRAAIPTPEGDADVESDEFRLLDSGAAGAFVHGLEDEYQEVRDAAIESITELCAASADFSAKAVDFLVDMFNDSSDRVRACAIRALTSIGDRALIQITEEQLSIALSAMKDSSSRVRAGIYRFLSVTTLARAEWMERLMSGFRANLERYAHDDQHAIYAALRALGQNHSHIVSIHLARSLLGISEHYLSREARIDDAVYAGSVILLMNTKPPSRAAIAAALPDYVSTHLPYLRDKYPDCLPADVADSVPPRLGFVKQMLSRPRPDLSISRLTLADSQKHVDGVFAAIASALEQAAAAGDAGDGTAVAAALLARRARELEALCTGDSGRDRAEPDERHLAVAHYARLVGHILDTQAAARAPPAPQRPRVLDLAARVMRGAYELAGRTAGLDAACKQALSGARVFAHAAWLAAHDLAAYDHRLADKMVRELLRRMRGAVGATSECARQRLPESMHRLEKAWHAVSRSSSNDDGGSTDPGGIPSDLPLQGFERELAAFVAAFRPMPFMPPGLCRRARARVSSQVQTAVPASQQQQQQHHYQQPTEYNHAFPLRLSLSASVGWVPRRGLLGVAVGLPTRQTLYLAPPAESVRPRQPMHWAVEWADVAVSLPLGSGESTSVRVSVVLRLPAHVPWSDAFVVRGAAVPHTHTVGEYFRRQADPALRYVCVDIADEGCAVSVNPVHVAPPASAHTRV